MEHQIPYLSCSGEDGIVGLSLWWQLHHSCHVHQTPHHLENVEAVVVAAVAIAVVVVDVSPTQQFYR